MRRFLSALLLALLAGCDISGGNPAFRATGEVIAMGGGNGGAASACATCHGLRGEGDGALTPRLAGLDAGYLHRQIDDFANGRRQHAPMRQVARQLSGNDRALVSAYYAALDNPADRMPARSTLFQSRCASCHGANGEGMGAANPPLAGQPEAYIAAQLTAWKSGRRRGEGLDQMLHVSRALTTDEIQALAALARPHARDPRPTPAASR